MEDRGLKALGGNRGKRGIGIAQNQNGVRLFLFDQFIGRGDDVPHRPAEVIPDAGKIEIRFAEPKLFEEDLIQFVVIILAGVDEDMLELAVAGFDDFG